MARSKYKSANNLYQLREDVASVCREMDVPDPVRFNAYVMSGRDPRNFAFQVVEMIRKIEQNYLDGNRETDKPDDSEWKAIIREAFETKYDKAPVGFAESQKSSFELMKYLHKNLVEIKTDIEVKRKRDIKPATKQEISDFLDLFDQRY